MAMDGLARYLEQKIMAICFNPETLRGCRGRRPATGHGEARHPRLLQRQELYKDYLKRHYPVLVENLGFHAVFRHFFLGGGGGGLEGGGSSWAGELELGCGFRLQGSVGPWPTEQK